jgi:hypothetical protein
MGCETSKSCRRGGGRVHLRGRGRGVRPGRIPRVRRKLRQYLLEHYCTTTHPTLQGTRQLRHLSIRRRVSRFPDAIHREFNCLWSCIDQAPAALHQLRKNIRHTAIQTLVCRGKGNGGENGRTCSVVASSLRAKAFTAACTSLGLLVVMTCRMLMSATTQKASRGKQLSSASA